jgi:ankyrin repeat protein
VHLVTAFANFSRPFFRFRWVYCQLETLHQCLPQNVRRFLDELPESLDKTYEQILKGIPKPKVEQARRLLRCLAVSVRPLRVEELAELLAFDFPDEAHEGKIPILDVNWRLENKEEAILSICSSLITVVQNADSRVVQFSHFSVKEYLTSPRLALSNCDFSQFHIRLEPAHTILAQACLGTLLRLDQGGGNGVAEEFPLADYAARHWAAHAQLAAVSSGIQKGMDDLFDLSKPYFTAWLRTHDIDKDRDDFTSWSPPSTRRKSPLYYAALCGLYDLAKRLIVKYPGDIQPAGDRMFAPLPAALRRKHFRVADLLYQHGAAVDIRDFLKNTTLHTASMYGLTDIVQWLLDHGADVNSQAGDCWTPLHLAANNNHPEVVQVLLDNNADVHASTGFKETPLSFAIDANHLGVVKILLERGADPNARGSERLCPLHIALTWRSPEVARLLLEHGANAHEKDKRGMSPFEVASVEGLDEITELLSEYGAKPEP